MFEALNPAVLADMRLWLWASRWGPFSPGAVWAEFLSPATERWNSLATLCMRYVHHVSTKSEAIINIWRVYHENYSLSSVPSSWQETHPQLPIVLEYIVMNIRRSSGCDRMALHLSGLPIWNKVLRENEPLAPSWVTLVLLKHVIALQLCGE
jgi:hypothetical protein